MARHENVLVTYKCDLPGCLEEATLAGINADNEAIGRGWALSYPIGDEGYDLCPDHITEVQDWLKGHDEEFRP